MFQFDTKRLLTYKNISNDKKNIINKLNTNENNYYLFLSFWAN